ncbi:MAG: 4,5-dihydroxyphthalate decarboxylase [Telmatospirillum sp.]|nr:4,5-dihydroxyphthalate decarboxylase [Telmatospirillum sp.]
MTNPITLACWDHDRAMPVVDGTVPVPGFALETHVLPTSQLFPIAVQEARFDVTELSLSSHLLQVSRGDAAYTAIPVFLSRAFRHNGFFRRAGAGIATLADFRGRRIGVPEYQMTAGLWMRGILADDFGVNATDIRWRTGALDAGVRRERLALAPPPELQIEPIEDGRTLQDLLRDGEIDGLLAPAPPKAFLAGEPWIERVFPDFEAIERDYHARTGFFPIMHVIAVRRSLAVRHPELPRLLYDAFGKARDIALARLNDVWLGSANRLSLPWLNASMERTLASLGTHYWPYGFAGARAELAAACRYSIEQHLAVRAVAPEELFDPSVLDT